MQEALTKLINHTWITYRGCLIERTKKGFRRSFGLGFKEFCTLEEAKADVDDGILKLQLSIKKSML